MVNRKFEQFPSLYVLKVSICLILEIYNNMKSLNPFNLPSRPIIHEENRDISHGVVVIEGSQIINTLCPVSKLTKLPMDITSAISMAINDPSLSGLVSQIVQTLPSIPSDSRLTDGDRLDLLISNFDLGTPAETDRVRASLMEIADQLFPKPEQIVEQAESPVAEVEPSAE